MSNTTDRPDDTNLSTSRALDGVSENTAAIPAVSPSADRRSDSGGKVSDPLPIAPLARTSRRGFIMNSIVSATALATATAVDTPSIAGAAPPSIPSIAPAAEAIDPIFAAIAAHQKAAELHSKCVRHQFALEEALPRDKCRSSPCGSEVVETDDPRWIEAVRASNDACDRMFELAIALIDTPTSVAGVVALLKYVSDNHRGDEDWMFPEFVSGDEDEDDEDELGEPYQLAVMRHAGEALDRMTTSTAA